MGTRTNKSCGLLRPLVGLVAAYSIAFHTILFGIAGSQVQQAEFLDSGLPGFVICHTDIGADSKEKAPAESDDCKFHCVLCASGPAVLAAPSFISDVVLAPINLNFGAIANDDAPPSSLYLSELPRGPPLET